MAQHALVSHQLPRAPTRKSPRKQAQNPPLSDQCNRHRLNVPRRSASAATVQSIVSLPDRMPEGSAFMPVSILHRRILPLLAGEKEANAFNSKVARSMRDWGRARGAFVRFTWVPDFERFRGLHGHGLLIAPHHLALKARKFFRKTVARHARVKALPPHTLKFETRRGPVQPQQAVGYLQYCAGKLIQQGEIVAGVKGAASPDRPLKGRRCGLPRSPSVMPISPDASASSFGRTMSSSRGKSAPNSVATPPATGRAARSTITDTRSPGAAQIIVRAPAGEPEEAAMPRFLVPDPEAPLRIGRVDKSVPGTAKSGPWLLKDFQCDEVSICRSGANKLSRILIAKDANGPVIVGDPHRTFQEQEQQARKPAKATRRIAKGFLEVLRERGHSTTPLPPLRRPAASAPRTAAQPAPVAKAAPKPAPENAAIAAARRAIAQAGPQRSQAERIDALNHGLERLAARVSAPAAARLAIQRATRTER